MWSIAFVIALSLIFSYCQGHVGPGGGYGGECAGGSHPSFRPPPPCGGHAHGHGHAPAPLPYAPMPPPVPPPPYQLQDCRSCPWRNPLPPMFPPPQILPLEVAQSGYATRLPIQMTQDSYATRLPIPAQEKLLLKEKNVETKINNPFEETSPPKTLLPATLASGDSDKEPSVRPLTYESLPPRYPTYPAVPAVPELAPSYQAIPPPVPPPYQAILPPAPPRYQGNPPPVPPPYQGGPPPVALPQNCQPHHRPVYPNTSPPHAPLRPLQPPPLNNCCARCDRGCKHVRAHSKTFVSKTKNATNTLKFFDSLDFNNPNECTSKQLKTIIQNVIF